MSIATQYPSNLFSTTKNPDGSFTLIADASTLKIPPGKRPFGQLWTDSIDLGLRIQSSRTGDVVDFVETNYHHNNCDTMWTAENTGASVEKHGKIYVTIFND